MSALNVYICTFNCAREKVKPEVLARHLVNAWPNSRGPDVLILSLQEIAPIAYSFLGGSYLIPYFDRFRYAIELAASSMPNGIRYTNIITRNVGMTAIMAFIPNDQANNVKWLETAGVGVGVHAMGNKGAVGLRMGYVYGEELIELTTLGAHLAPMEPGLKRRNEDWANIVRGLVFTPVNKNAVHTAKNSRGSQDNAGENEPLVPGSPDNSTSPTSGLYTPTSHLVLAGDLNYRTSQSKPSPADYQFYPQPTTDVTNPKHFSHLLKADQLLRELKAGRTCHGLKEAPIKFPPTYKYSDKQQAVAETDNGSTWDWAKHRYPSWCDRILYLDLPPWMKAEDPSASILVNSYTSLPLMSTSDHRPVTLSLSLPAKAIPVPTETAAADGWRIRPPLAIDPHWRESRTVARRKEIIVGLISFLGLTWEGRMALLAAVIGALGGWFIVMSILET